MKRRDLIRNTALAAGISCLPDGFAAAAASSTHPLSLLVAGPAGELISRWGNACGLAMAANFPGAPEIVPQADGGLDGVTGANTLDALVVPDGNTAAILPGAALIAWLTGDPRVHFDPTRWVPVMAGCGSGVLVVRAAGGTPMTLDNLRAMAPLRLAADAPQSNDLAALLALERMGVRTAPVFGLHCTETKTKAFINGDADAVFLAGEGVPEDVAPLAANQGVPVFSLGALGGDGGITADPLFPALPDAVGFSGLAASPLDALYYAAAAAARLDFLMVLPRLTDSSAVAQWRAAAAGGVAAPAMADAASASSITLGTSPTAASALLTISAAQSHQAGLQAFLVQRFGWQPG
jgi:hypothetical protein